MIVSSSFYSPSSSLTAVVFALQDGRVEVLGRASVRGGGGQHGVVPLPRLHRARLVTQDIHQRSDAAQAGMEGWEEREEEEEGKERQKVRHRQR